MTTTLSAASTAASYGAPGAGHVYTAVCSSSWVHQAAQRHVGRRHHRVEPVAGGVLAQARYLRLASSHAAECTDRHRPSRLISLTLITSIHFSESLSSGPGSRDRRAQCCRAATEVAGLHTGIIRSIAVLLGRWFWWPQHVRICPRPVLRRSDCTPGEKVRVEPAVSAVSTEKVLQLRPAHSACISRVVR